MKDKLAIWARVSPHVRKLILEANARDGNGITTNAKISKDAEAALKELGYTVERHPSVVALELVHWDLANKPYPLTPALANDWFE